MVGTSKLMAFAPARDLERAKIFYKNVLGLRFVRQDDFAIVLNACGTMVRVAKIREFEPASYTILGWQISNIERMVEKLQARGVRFERYEFMKQDQHGIWTSPSKAKIAWFRDPDGNVLSLTEFPGRASKQHSSSRKRP
jgi:catechol 2,3-dioxygenase-like lactoylglutathione lyase family enzyme